MTTTAPAAMDDTHLIQVARLKYCYRTDDIEIDDNATISHGEDGSWVQAWVWIPHERIEPGNNEPRS